MSDETEDPSAAETNVIGLDCFRLRKADIGEPAKIYFKMHGRVVMAFHGDGRVEFSTHLEPEQGSQAAWKILTDFTAQHNIDVRAAMADRDRLAAEVARLRADLSLWIGRAEVAEAQRQSADDALVDKYRKPGSGVFKFPSDVAAIVMRLDAAEAEVERLTEALDEMVDAASDRAARYADMDDMDSEASAANLIAKDLSEIRGRAHAARREGEA